MSTPNPLDSHIEALQWLSTELEKTIPDVSNKDLTRSFTAKLLGDINTSSNSTQNIVGKSGMFPENSPKDQASKINTLTDGLGIIKKTIENSKSNDPIDESKIKKIIVLLSKIENQKDSLIKNRIWPLVFKSTNTPSQKPFEKLISETLGIAQSNLSRKAESPITKHFVYVDKKGEKGDEQIEEDKEQIEGHQEEETQPGSSTAEIYEDYVEEGAEGEETFTPGEYMTSTEEYVLVAGEHEEGVVAGETSEKISDVGKRQESAQVEEAVKPIEKDEITKARDLVKQQNDIMKGLERKIESAKKELKNDPTSIPVMYRGDYKFSEDLEKLEKLSLKTLQGKIKMQDKFIGRLEKALDKLTAVGASKASSISADELAKTQEMQKEGMLKIRGDIGAVFKQIKISNDLEPKDGLAEIDLRYLMEKGTASKNKNASQQLADMKSLLEECQQCLKFHRTRIAWYESIFSNIDSAGPLKSQYQSMKAKLQGIQQEKNMSNRLERMRAQAAEWNNESGFSNVPGNESFKVF